MIEDAIFLHTLEALRLRGTVYFQADFRAPWGMAIPVGEKTAAFHVVADGRCWLRLADEAPRLLVNGDIVLLPHGTSHELVHDSAAEARPASELLSAPSQGGASIAYGGSGTSTTLVCGHFEYDREALHPFFKSLPRVVHISTGQEEQAAWLATASKLAAAESESGQRGASVVVDRLAEALLLQTLHLFLRSNPEPRGFLAAAQDPSIGRVLSCIHELPDRDWTLHELAHEARLSKSTLAERFRDLVGESPIRYLYRWRMLEARKLLQEPTLSTATVAERVGYRSEFAFAKAFKRFFGEGPGAARRSA